MANFTLTVNGRDRTVDAAPDTPLLWVLRDSLDLTGTKFGCGIGMCRACTVLVDGAAKASCLVRVNQVGTQAITTIEGFAENQSHPLLQAWIAEEVSQCGYCQSGQLLAAAALLDQHPKPSDEEIDRSMAPNLCRCGTYPRIRRAIRRAAGEVSHG
ncbi:MAG TPA: (2Fe-2S)-binding protein [Gemmatimonadales bacterium]|nr:(2Fe-2S)-binding protein [Gemmatimonadales bacterium]